MSGEDAAREVRRPWRESPLATRLGRRLLGWFLLLALLPLLASNVIGYLRSHQITEEVLEQSLEAVTQVQVLHVRNRIDRYLALLSAVAVGNEFLASGTRAAGGVAPSVMGGAATRPALDTYLQRQLLELADFSELILLGLEGEFVASTTPLEWSEEHPRRVEIAGPVEAFRGAVASDPPALRFSVSLTGIRGDHVGFLMGIVGPARLPSFFQIPEHVAGDIESLILDQEWRPLYVSHPHGPVDYSNPLETILAEMSLGTATNYQDRDGVKVIGRASEIPESSWIYLTEQPDAHALGALRQLRQASIYVAFAFALLVVGAAWFVSGGIVAPVHRLVDATRRLGAGDLKARVDPVTRDEIGALSLAFNEMASELAQSASRVKELHQREIERAQQLATVGELASGLAHEIKNPVMGISSGLDLVKRRVGDDPEVELLMEQLTQEVGRIERAIRDLLAFARPSDPQLGSVEANQVAESALRLVQPFAEQSGVFIDLRLVPELPPLLADGEMMRQALVNLLVNAVQATEPGGRIQISTGIEEENVRFRVEDTGRGISKDHLDRVFRPFFTTRHSGTGLGLSISREIIERHGGRLEVVSEEGQGTVFKVMLPFDPEVSDGDEDSVVRMST